MNGSLDVELQIDRQERLLRLAYHFKEPEERIAQCCQLVPVCDHRLLHAKVVSQLQATHGKFPVYH